MNDLELFDLLCGKDPARFDELRDEISARLNAMSRVMIATAQKRAPDLVAGEVAQNVAVKAAETLFDQFNGKNVGYRFDPKLAPFNPWIFNMMGGAGTRGVIDSMRAAHKRESTRLQGFDSEEALDHTIQQHHSGARWHHGGSGSSVLRTDSFDIDGDFDARDLLSTLSPRENLIMRWEIGLDQFDVMEAYQLRQVVKDCGFTMAEEDDMMRRALMEGFSQTRRKQERLAWLLDLSTRSVRALKASACAKLKQRVFEGEWPERDRSAG